MMKGKCLATEDICGTMILNRGNKASQSLSGYVCLLQQPSVASLARMLQKAVVSQCPGGCFRYRINIDMRFASWGSPAFVIVILQFTGKSFFVLFGRKRN